MSQADISRDNREFSCVHCSGRIQIPWNLPPTTGPCPHCGGTITSPPLAEENPDLPAHVPPVPVPVIARPVAAAAAPVAIPPAPEPPAVREAPEPSVPSIPPRRSDPAPPEGKPIEPARKDSRNPPPKVANKRSEGPPSKSGLIPVMLVLLLLVLAIGAGIFYAASEMGRNIPPPSTVRKSGPTPVNEDHYLRIGWQKEAYEVLRGYLAGTSATEKLPFILNADALAPKIGDFYGGVEINDSDTPVDSFSPYDLSLEDRKRGLFLMIYDRPVQFDIKEFFRPLASAEVQAGIDEAGLLLSSVARVGNFTMEPLRTHAYFKRTPQGLKLDWEVFAQTKYRTLQSFVELPEASLSAVFRVFIVEDVPNKRLLEPGYRTYRVIDTAHPTDSARINVKVDSEIGHALSVINWREIKDARPITRTATVELKWGGEESSPQLEISRFVCWEFIGLGGQETPAKTPPN
jgi:hypothetical protein